MNKLGLIISREYLTKVKNWKFILTTLLTPLGFLVFFIVIGIIFSYEGDKTYKIAVINKSSMQLDLPSQGEKFNFIISNESMETLRAGFETSGTDGIWVLPEMAGVDVSNYTSYFYSNNPLDIEMESRLEKYLEEGIRDHKIKLLALDKSELDKLKTKVSIDPEPIAPEEKDRSAHTVKIATVIGGAMGYIIFFIIFLYGASVMRSVADEKVNRVVEVIISSAKPVELMLGKVIGVGLVGLTQILIWLILIPVIYFLGMQIAGIDVQQLQEASQPMSAQAPIDQDELATIIREIAALNWLKIGLVFILYFIGGYFLYASMFAAIGAATGDDINDAQSLTIIVTIPIILAIYVMFQAIRLPESSLATFAAFFPLFSPITMPALLAFDPPWWKVLLSLLVLFGFCYVMIWLASRIYRVGILMYGKKASLKEIGRWILKS
ncbi:MAG: ABC transporter permease [Saprospiraceae bacterium]|nr:ABC transporter permease [Saprospiraceae bacterium]